MVKDFDRWNRYKQLLDATQANVYYRTREVWWCSIGVNIGREQDGHHERFERPVLVLRRFNSGLFWGVPISTKLKPTNPYYLAFKHEDELYSAIISQMRIFDTRRLVRKLYTLDQFNYAKIKSNVIRELAIA